MKKQVYIIHSWGGSPNEPMHQWLKLELERRGFDVAIPMMPHPENPTIKDWVLGLSQIIRLPDKNVILVGHSIGCQTILRYLEELPANAKVGGAVFIAPWLTLSNLESDEEWTIAEPWLRTEINDSDIIKHLSKITAIFSDSDQFVPPENIEKFQKRFGAEIIIEHEKGHFTTSNGVTKLQSALDAVLRIASEG